MSKLLAKSESQLNLQIAAKITSRSEDLGILFEFNSINECLQPMLFSYLFREPLKLSSIFSGHWRQMR
jgi:hypothetical protein